MPTANCQLPIANRQKGFTLLGLLFLIAGLGVAMAALGTLWHTAAQREKEKDLLFAGNEYRRAIESFWKASPKDQERLPKNFNELLEDPRFPHTVRHLRRLYPDPMTGLTEWGVVKGPGDGIAGVYSLSRMAPMKEAEFPRGYEGFEAMPSYREWVFLFKLANGGTQADQALTQGNGVAGNENKANGGSTETTTTDLLARLNKIQKCEEARQEAYMACLPYRDARDQAAWNACAGTVTGSIWAAFRECMRE